MSSYGTSNVIESFIVAKFGHSIYYYKSVLTNILTYKFSGPSKASKSDQSYKKPLNTIIAPVVAPANSRPLPGPSRKRPLDESEALTVAPPAKIHIKKNHPRFRNMFQH